MSTAAPPDALRDVVARATAAAADSSRDGNAGRALSAAILDGLLQPTVDWRAAIERWPVLTVATVGMAGFLVGRHRGAAVLAGVAAGLGRHFVGRLETLGEELAEETEREDVGTEPAPVSVATPVPPDARPVSG